MKMTKENYQDLIRISDISNDHVSLSRRMTQAEWGNLENQSLAEFQSFYTIHPLEHDYSEDLKKAIESGNILIGEFLPLFHLYLEFINDMKEEYPHVNIYHNENNFDDWFEQLFLKDVPEIFSSMVDTRKEEIFPSYDSYLFQIERFTYYCRGIVPYSGVYKAYCVTAPVIFPKNRKELSNIGSKMAAIFYLDLLSKIFDKNKKLKKHLDFYDLNNLEDCIAARRISRLFYFFKNNT